MSKSRDKMAGINNSEKDLELPTSSDVDDFERMLNDFISKVKKLLEEGKLRVFDTNTFTVEGKKLDSFMADVDTDDNYTPDTEVIKDGYFHESEYRAAPYFNIFIDGITLVNTNFG